ncbi:hypothetical protein TcWFU_010119 [Taenia crassiceps]|uniref:Uncharacterized protein n=1 Tax=Taenia crassiceps TaxID=6207 RepID=A0ABR4QN99_9CEST
MLLANRPHACHSIAPHRTAPHRTAPHRTAPHSTVLQAPTPLSCSRRGRALGSGRQHHSHHHNHHIRRRRHFTIGSAVVLKVEGRSTGSGVGRSTVAPHPSTSLVTQGTPLNYEACKTYGLFVLPNFPLSHALILSD